MPIASDADPTRTYENVRPFPTTHHSYEVSHAQKRILFDRSRGNAMRLTLSAKKIKDASGEQVYVIIFHRDDDALSGLTDFVIQNKIRNGHFTGIGAAKNAILGWLDLGEKAYHSIPVTQQSEVLSLIGDVAVYKGKPTIHAHAVLSGPSGSTIGGHVWRLVVDPTLEVFLTVDAPELIKKPDNASGLNLIDVGH